MREALARTSSERRRRPRLPRGFTLIEVLVVVAIIAVLVAILLPSLSRARAQAKTALCTSQLQQLMRAALLYKTDARDRAPGVGRNDAEFESEYALGYRRDWLTWFGTWTVLIDISDRGRSNAKGAAWRNAPRSGRLWKYYHDEAVLKCPSSVRYNGKTSYSTPENVALAMPDPSTDLKVKRAGLPPLMDRVKHPQAAIQFLDEDEQNGISNYSLDDGFGEGDMFADRHLGRATAAFFDGHAEAQFFPRGKQQNGIRTTEPFKAWMIQIAPFNSRETPLPWNFRGVRQMPRFKLDANWPYLPCSRVPPGCE